MASDARAQKVPAFSADAIGLVVLPVSGCAFALGQLAPFRARLPGWGPTMACQRGAPLKL